MHLNVFEKNIIKDENWIQKQMQRYNALHLRTIAIWIKAKQPITGCTKTAPCNVMQTNRLEGK